MKDISVGNTCTGVQQSVLIAERSGDTLGWKLKCWPAERWRSIRLFKLFFFFWWQLRNDFHLFSCIFARMRVAHPGKPHGWKAQIYTRCVTCTQWRFSENGSDQTVHADSNPVTRVSMNADGWKKRAGATEVEAERYTVGVDEEEAFTGFNHSKTLSSYWGYQTFYESRCSHLQHYNSVPVQNKSAAAL